MLWAYSWKDFGYGVSGLEEPAFLYAFICTLVYLTDETVFDIVCHSFEILLHGM